MFRLLLTEVFTFLFLTNFGVFMKEDYFMPNSLGWLQVKKTFFADLRFETIKNEYLQD